jgi:hypothetical protein
MLVLCFENSIFGIMFIDSMYNIAISRKKERVDVIFHYKGSKLCTKSYYGIILFILLKLSR